MTVQSHIDSVANRAILTQTERDSIARSISALKSRLDSYFGASVIEQLQFGSSTRGTNLPRSMDQRSDIDYLIVFSDEDAKPQTYISRLKKFAEKYYSSSEIKQSHPTIVLSLNHISFDLVPAIKGFWEEYKIPAPATSYTDWISTSPKDFNSTISDRNKACDFKLKPAIRVLKYWNSSSGYIYDSYLLEKWCADRFFIFNSTTKDYFFDLVGNLQLDWNSPQWKKERVERAKAIVSKTQEYLNNGMPINAEIEINKLVP